MSTSVARVFIRLVDTSFYTEFSPLNELPLILKGLFYAFFLHLRDTYARKRIFVIDKFVKSLAKEHDVKYNFFVIKIILRREV